MTDPAEQSITVAGGATAGMSITGSNVLAKGKSLTYKLNRKLPKDSVKWKIEGAPAGVTINAKSGKVSTKSSSSGSFTVVAETTAGNVSKKVDLVEGATGVTLLAPAADKDPNKEVNIPVNAKNGNLRSARLYNVNVRNTTRVENVLKLDGKTVGNTAPVEFSSSKPSVATVDATGKVTAKKAGTVKITCKAGDGSGKKAVVTIKVIVPVSRLDMFLPKAMQAVCYGKSMKVRAAIGSAYGKPTIRKIEWEKDPVKVVGYSSGSTKDATAQIKEAGLISVKNGNLKVDKKIGSIEGYDFFKVTVRAKATDGSGISLEKEFTVVPPATVLRLNPAEPDIKKKPVLLYAYSGTSGYMIPLFTGDFGWGYAKGTNGHVLRPEIKSSNPQVASAYLDSCFACDDGIGYTVTIVTKKVGTANITIYATDGSGKKATLSVKTIPNK
ncbi:MAG: Ig-like domain-containing protein [Lachnospiraceae bacterium]|nr:Ig-like domain-containing protein [Lachnospiraceae bacterium]